MNKIIGIIGLIVSLIVQGFSASGSLTHKIAMACLFIFLIIYNFENSKDFSKKSLIVLGAIFIALMLGIYQLISFTGDYFHRLNLNIGLIILLEIALIIVLVSIAVNLMKLIANRLRKTTHGKEF
ncbi:YoqO family protein [Bacillus inaquosorum]|uniref:YoqO family protein n=1 Tax=Bacillus inaquosorum TaxID=483913 RepID=UPI00227FD56F|nr:YoqO family protein [Bacillus inaquosorum]MCY9011440.1 YoqO family protein [Bacillus inaquosorum]MCY9039684.1 YoqO family protein [Bacillus inaquosorum]MCY9045138.1 YoqO family protein [Bacillus inaquosorum]